MAVSTTSYFNNGIQGIPGIGADVDIYETSTKPRYAVGTRFTRSDGAEFVYGHFGAATLAGLLVSQDFSESSSLNANTKTYGRVYTTTSVTAIAGETISPGSAGSHYVQIKMGGVTQDKFAGGYFQVLAGYSTQTYRIRGNTASAQLTSGALYTFYLELYEPLQTTLGTTSAINRIRITGSPYSNLESADAASDFDAVVVGATTVSHAASTWGWVQAKGMAGVRTDNSGPAMGSLAALSRDADGCVTHAGARLGTGARGRQPVIGYGIDSGIAGANIAMVYLQL